MKCHPYHSLIITLLISLSLVALAPNQIVEGATNQSLNDPDNYLYDVTTGSGSTNISGGTSDAYDGAYILRIDVVSYDAKNLSLVGRNIVASAETLSNLGVTRKLYVPSSKDGELGNFGRWYDSLYNPTGMPITVSIEYYSDLGSDFSTVITKTGDGDTIVEIKDQWVATDDSSDGGGDPSLAHVIYIPGGREEPDFCSGSMGSTIISWRYDNVRIEPGQTIAFLTFAIQEKTRAKSWQEAEGIVASLNTEDLNSVALRGLSSSEYGQLVNIPALPPCDLVVSEVEPPEDFNSVGDEGNEPEMFNPPRKEYILTNTGSNSLDWVVEPNVLWLDPNSGILLGGDSIIVTICLNDSVADLDPNTYFARIFFRNLTSGCIQTRNATLRVKKVAGEIEVEPNELNFGDVIVGLSKTKKVTICNIDLNTRHELIVAEISLSGSSQRATQTGKADVLLLAADAEPTYLRTGLSAFSDINVDYLYCGGTTPTLGYLLAYDVVVLMSWWDYYFADPTQMGDVLADYIDAGGKVIQAMVTFCTGDGMEISGRFVTGGYEPFIHGDYYEYFSPSLSLGDFDVGHPIMDGISTITDYACATVSLQDGAEGVADWSNDMPLVATKGADVVGINMYLGNDWFTGDVPMLFHNAIIWLLSSGPPNGFLLEGVPALPLTIGSGDCISFDVNFAPNEVREYQSTLVIKSDDEDEPVVEVKLKGKGIRDYLVVEPNENSVYKFSGHQGGPFLPPYQTYDLTNIGPNDINWTAEPNMTWLNVDPNGGTLEPNESIRVKVRPNDEAKQLPKGDHCGGLIFLNSTTGKEHSREVCLDVYTESKIWVRPPYFEVTIPQGATLTENLDIGNKGDSNLTFTLSSQTISSPPQTPSPGSRGLESGLSGLEAKDIKMYDSGKLDFSKLDEASYAPGDLLVRFAPKADRTWPNIAEKNTTLQASFGSASIVHEYKIVPGLCLVKLPAGVTVKNTLLSFKNTAGILYAEPDYKIKLLSDCQLIPDDPRFDELWGMQKICTREAWCIRTNTSDVIVAVLDAGIDYTHTDLKGNMWVNEGELNGNSGEDDDRNGYTDDVYGYDFSDKDPDPKDYLYHGTHVAGTIGAMGNNATGVAGVCWNVKIMALKIFPNHGDDAFNSGAIEAIEYAIYNGAKVLNNSWGGGKYSQSLEQTIDQADKAGLIFLAAAGNGDLFGNPINNDNAPQYPSSYDLNNIIAVMATDRYDNRSSFSNYGATSVDIAAPGTDILSTFPTYMTTEMMENGYSTYYETISGTSMATPHVAGACALVWSVCPTLSHLEVKDVIMQTVDPLPALEGKCVSGGRLNLYNAVLKAEELAQTQNGEPSLWCELIPNAGTVTPGGVNDVNVIFDANRALGTYRGDIIIESNDPYRGRIEIPVTMTVEPIDYFTELFDVNDPFHPYSLSTSDGSLDTHRNDMANRILTFIPDGSFSYYRAYTCAAMNFPVDSNGGTDVTLDDDDYVAVYLGGQHVSLYGIEYDTLYIGSNGYITLGDADTRHHESLIDHFDLPRVSALFDDLDPSAGGRIWWKQLSDRVVVTFEDVPEFSRDNANSFQVEMFFNGTIRIAWLAIAAQDGLIGLSEGDGLPSYFVESDLSEYGLLGDLNSDRKVDFIDYALLTARWMDGNCAEPNWCDGVDLNKSGSVDLFDLAEFAELWHEGSK